MAAAVLMLTFWLYSSGDVFYLEVDPVVTDGLPGHQVSVSLFRPYASLAEEVNVRLENLNPETVEVPETIVIPQGKRYVEIPVQALSPGGANIRARADAYGEVTFTINVLGPPEVVKAVNPPSIRLRLGKGDSATVGVFADMPADAVPSSADIAFAIDDRLSFANGEARLAAATPAIIAKLKSAFPGVNFAFSVSKFQDYGGPGRIFQRLAPLSPDVELARPFALLLPMTMADTSDNVSAITNAMKTVLPGRSPLSAFASYLEALNQIAQGAGFDADGNGSNLDGGPAGAPGGGSQPGFLSPGTSGDVPPFSSRPPSVPSAGTFGGVGFRTGSQKMVLLATNTAPVSPVDRAKTFPDAITGFKGVQISAVSFAEVLAYSLPGTVQNPRFGYVSASVSAADPVTAVAPKGAITVPDVFKVLAGQKIQVIGFFQISEFIPSGGLIDPKLVLSDIARLTGAVDSNGVPLTFELIGATADQVADLIVQAVRPTLQKPRKVTLQAVGNDAGFGFSFTPDSVTVGPGGRASFNVTITGTGSPGSFEIQIVSEDGTIIGRIPVTIEVPVPATPTITGITPASGPIGTQVTITGTNLSAAGSTTTVTFGGLQAQVISTSEISILTVVPAGSVAGSVPVVATVGNSASNTFPFTVLHTITSFSPTSGPTGTAFTIQGSAFASSVSGNTVNFGTTAAAITDAANTQVRGTVPNVVVGSYPVTISTNGVTTPVGTFQVIPLITSIVPTSGPGNSSFTINGGGFSTSPGENTITFTDKATGGTATAAITSASVTALAGTVPVQLVAGSYTVAVTVRETSTNSVPFTVLPFITVTPSVVGPGGQLRITGTGFSPKLTENVVTLNGNVVSLDAGSSQSALLVTVAPGTTGTALAVVVTVRGVASNNVTVGLSQNPVILSVKAVFQTRESIAVTISGADPNGDVRSVAITFKDGEGQVLGSFDAISVQSILANQPIFAFTVPFAQANHFTAASTVVVQLTDAAGNTSAAVTAPVTNPDIRADALPASERGGALARIETLSQALYE